MSSLRSINNTAHMVLVIFFIFMHKNIHRTRFQEIKIVGLEGIEKIEFFTLSLMRKRLPSGHKWFLRPYFPLIKGMFVFRSGLRLEVCLYSEVVLD